MPCFRKSGRLACQLNSLTQSSRRTKSSWRKINVRPARALNQLERSQIYFNTRLQIWMSLLIFSWTQLALIPFGKVKAISIHSLGKPAKKPSMISITGILFPIWTKLPPVEKSVKNKMWTWLMTSGVEMMITNKLHSLMPHQRLRESNLMLVVLQKLKEKKAISRQELQLGGNSNWKRSNYKWLSRNYNIWTQILPKCQVKTPKPWLKN